MNPPTENSKSPKFPWVRLFRIFVVASVIGAVIYTGLSASKQLSENDFDFRNTEFGWWIAAIGCYIVTLVLSSFFWHRVLVAMGQSPKFGKSLLAFFASQLGKYIPGKAMVVVIRTDMIRGDKVGTAPAAASVFVETLTWIFVGSAIASLLLIFRFQDQVGLQITAALLTIVAGVLTWPPIFRAIALKLGAAKGRSVAKAFSGLDFSTMSFGWVVMALGWCFNGFSLWLVLKGLPDTNVTIADFPLTLACVCLLYTSDAADE